MRHTKQIKETPETKVVANEAVTDTIGPDYFRERYLKRSKKLFQLENDVLVDTTTPAADATAQHANGQKLLLHKSVSRYKPPQQQLHHWVTRMRSQPMLKLKSGCHITLAQPNTRRPGRTFSNPHLPPGKYNYNDGLAFGALVLLHAGRHPSAEYDEASHLCGQARCVNPRHLHWEDIGTNSSRNLCHLYGQPCTHEPPCVPYNSSDKHIIAERLAQQKGNKKRKRKQ